MERVILEIAHPYGTATQRMVISSGRILIGRGYHCEVILDDPYVSEEHVEVILSEDGHFLIADKGSVNGVFIGAKKALLDTPVRLESGQEIKIGKTRIRAFAPRHAVQPAQPHNLLSSIFQFCDRPLTGILVSVVAALLVVYQSALVESADVDFWKETAPGIGMGFFLFIWIVWSVIHLSLVIKHKKIMPWPRIISYLSVVTLIAFSFCTLVMPYVDFYLLSSAPTMIFAAAVLFIFFSSYEYFSLIVCELPVKPKLLILGSAVLAASLVAIVNIDMDYDSDPVFPATIITADLPLPPVQPLDSFIEQAFAVRLK